MRQLIFLTTVCLLFGCRENKSNVPSSNQTVDEKEYYVKIDSAIIDCTEEQFYKDDWNDSLIRLQLSSNLPSGTKIIIHRGRFYNSAANYQDPRLEKIDTVILSDRRFQIGTSPMYAHSSFLDLKLDTTIQNESVKKILRRPKSDFSTKWNYTIHCREERDSNNLVWTVFPLELVIVKH